MPQNSNEFILNKLNSNLPNRKTIGAKHIWLTIAFLCFYGSMYFVIEKDATLGPYSRPLQLVAMGSSFYILYMMLSWMGNNPDVKTWERWFARIFWAINLLGIVIEIVVNFDALRRRLDIF